MEAQQVEIEKIPSVLWGSTAKKLFIAVHGDQSSKADAAIAILAEEAVQKGYQVLSFDLPEHGDRKDESRLCNAQNCVEDLGNIINYAHTISHNISLFGCSLGAYFSMLAYRDEPIEQALFLSPVVDMKRIINNMMMWFDVSEEQLEREQEVSTPVKTLYWDYYQYVLKNPIDWNKPTAILYGAKDNLCEFNYVNGFSERIYADITILGDGEHFFYTEKQLMFFQNWLKSKISR